MLWFYGIISVIIQTLLLRELAVLFQSNELILGILFFSWFIGTALGSSMFRFIPGMIRKAVSPASILLFLLNLVLLPMIVLIRFFYSFYQYQAVPNLFYLSAVLFILTLPVSFLTGACLTSLVKEYAKPLSFIYFIEGIAAAAGGMIFTFVIAGRHDAVIVAGAMLFISGVFAAVRSAAAGSVRAILLIVSICIPLCSPYIVKISRELEWRHNSKLVFSCDSKYGYIAEVENKGLSTIYYNGMVLCSSGASTLYEEPANLPLLVHGSPKTICITGYAAPEFLDEIMKYKPEKIIMIQPDEILAELARSYAESKHIPLEVIAGEPISSVNRLHDRFDVIFINTGLPSTIASDVYYTDYFYKRLAEHLLPDGIVAFGIPYEENNPGSWSLRVLKIIRTTLSGVFRYVAFIPADNFYFLASNRDYQPLKDRILASLSSEKAPDLKYVNSAYVNHYLDKLRITGFEAFLNSSGDPASGFLKLPLFLKTDRENNTLFSLRIYGCSLKKWVMNNMNESRVLIIIAAFVLLYLLWRNYRILCRYLHPGRYSGTMFFVGFVTIGGEILLLDYYQIVSGCLYYMYGLLTSLFMTGIGIGGYAGYKRRYINESCIKLSFSMLLLWLIGVWILYFLTKAGIICSILLVNFIVLSWNMYGGTALGLLFNSLATRRESSGIMNEDAVSELYSFDLIGSAAGALLTGPLLLPLFGYSLTLSIMCVILIAVMRKA